MAKSDDTPGRTPGTNKGGKPDQRPGRVPGKAPSNPPRASGGRTAWPIMVGAVGLVAVIIIAVIVNWTDAPDALNADIDSRPVGAGTNPDGAVDELNEGLTNQTTTDDFIDQSATSEATPTLLDIEEAQDDPAPGIQDLEGELPETVDDIVPEAETRSGN